MFKVLGISANVCAQLKERLIRSGIVNQVLKVRTLPLDHDGKRGELLW
jgi:hypothetical protein